MRDKWLVIAHKLQELYTGQINNRIFEHLKTSRTPPNFRIILSVRKKFAVVLLTFTVCAYKSSRFFKNFYKINFYNFRPRIKGMLTQLTTWQKAGEVQIIPMISSVGVRKAHHYSPRLSTQTRSRQLNSYGVIVTYM